MNSDQVGLIRRKIAKLSIGEQALIAIPDLEMSEVQTEASRFTSAKKLTCTFSITADGLVVTRCNPPEKLSWAPDLDAIAVGQSRVFDYPVSLHQRIRLAASNRARQVGGAFSCSREGDALRVTRIPATEAERVACGPIVVPARVTKYDLERLSTVRELHFNVPRADEAKLRLAAHRQGLKTGWTIRCRRQDDGSMLIYRTDDGAPAPAAPVGDSAAV